MEFLETSQEIKPLAKALTDYLEYLTVYLDKSRIKITIEAQHARGTDCIDIFGINVLDIG